MESNNNLTLNELEKIAIENALVECDFDLVSTANQLEIGRATLYRLIRTHYITKESLQKRIDDRNFEEIILKQ